MKDLVKKPDAVGTTIVQKGGSNITTSIPKNIREKLDIKSGDQLYFQLIDGRIIIEKI